MRGLIFRNLVINKKSLLCSVVLCIGMIYTLLDEIPNTEKEYMLYVNVCTFLCIIVIYSIAEYIYSSNNEEKWENFLKASPLSDKIIIGEKFVYDFVFITLGVIVSIIIILVAIYNSVYNLSFRFFTGILLAIMITYFYASIKKILVCIYGKKKAELIAVFSLILGVFLIIVITILANTEWLSMIEIDLNWVYRLIFSKKFILVVPISIFMHYCTYKICCNIYSN